MKIKTNPSNIAASASITKSPITNVAISCNIACQMETPGKATKVVNTSTVSPNNMLEIPILLKRISLITLLIKSSTPIYLKQFEC